MWQGAGQPNVFGLPASGGGLAGQFGGRRPSKRSKRVLLHWASSCWRHRPTTPTRATPALLRPSLQMREIYADTLAFQQRLNEHWEGYRALYDQVSAVATVSAACSQPPATKLPTASTPPLTACAPAAAPQEAEAAAGKQRAAASASLESMRAALAARAAEVARRIERGSKKASKMPELAQMLMPFLD